MENILKTLMKERNTYRLYGSEANKLTRECLQKALVCLMDEKDFEKISITELVKTSGVSRQSFYRNYRSKEDILVDMWKNIYQKVSEMVEDFKYQENICQWYNDLFALIRENGNTIKLLVQAKLNRKDGKGVLPVLHEIFPTENVEERYRLVAYEGALNAVVNEWIAQGMKDDTAYMANLCNGFFGEYHLKLLKNNTGEKED